MCAYPIHLYYTSYIPHYVHPIHTDLLRVCAVSRNDLFIGHLQYTTHGI